MTRQPTMPPRTAGLRGLTPLMHALLCGLLFVVVVGAADSQPPASSGMAPPGVGILVMAHGGDAAWNAAVEQAVEPLRQYAPCEVAFGMADAATMEAAVTRLEQMGARQIVVVRLFVDGGSFRERTAQILGLLPGAPPRPAGRGHSSPAAHGHADPHDPARLPFWRIATDATFVMSEEGLLESELTTAIAVDRVRALSHDPASETVLFLGHGVEDDAENDRWLAAMQRIADAVHATVPVREVAVATLREDWPAKRAEATRHIRTVVTHARTHGRTAIVVPLRLYGFGSYASVLRGLRYTADGHGLLPDPRVTDWITRQVQVAAARAGWTMQVSGENLSDRATQPSAIKPSSNRAIEPRRAREAIEQSSYRAIEQLSYEAIMPDVRNEAIKLMKDDERCTDLATGHW